MTKIVIGRKGDREVKSREEKISLQQERKRRKSSVSREDLTMLSIV